MTVREVVQAVDGPAVDEAHERENGALGNGAPRQDGPRDDGLCDLLTELLTEVGGTLRRSTSASSASLVTWRVPEVLPVPLERDMILIRTGSRAAGRRGRQ